jgi:uncharacterized membrane protein YraQ (UPF0718 family)
VDADPEARPPGGRRYVHLIVPVTLAAFALALSYAVSGTEGVEAGLKVGAADLLSIGPRICAAIVLAAVIQVWIPKDGLSRWFGSRTGLKGLGLATILGGITVGGPFASFPLVATLAAAGVEQGCLVAFLTGWSLLGVQRIIVWEWPLLGSDFVIVRVISCIAMPILAGLLMRALTRREAGGAA